MDVEPERHIFFIFGGKKHEKHSKVWNGRYKNR